MKKSELILCFVLVLSGISSGCKPPATLVHPSAERMRAWAGFPEGTKPTWGKPVWHYRYENRDRSLVTFHVMFFRPGTLWGTNHTKLPQIIQEQATKMQEMKSLGDKEKESIQVLMLPKGRKAYFFVLGFGPGGVALGAFSYERNFDLLVVEGFNSEDDIPVERTMKNPISPTNNLSTVFLNVRTSLGAQ